MNPLKYDCDLGPLREDKDKPQGQDHYVEMQPSDRLKIKCGHAEIIVWPVGSIDGREPDGYMYKILVIDFKHEKEL